MLLQENAKQSRAFTDSMNQLNTDKKNQRLTTLLSLADSSANPKGNRKSVAA